MADALVRLGGTLRLRVGVLDLFGGDRPACFLALLAPCQLFAITLGHLTFFISSRTTTWTLEATSMFPERRLCSRQPMPSTSGELMLALLRRRQSLVQASPTANIFKTTTYHADDSLHGRQ